MSPSASSLLCLVELLCEVPPLKENDKNRDEQNRRENGEVKVG